MHSKSPSSSINEYTRSFTSGVLFNSRGVHATIESAILIQLLLEQRCATCLLGGDDLFHSELVEELLCVSFNFHEFDPVLHGSILIARIH
jgi:hypothetical protein